LYRIARTVSVVYDGSAHTANSKTLMEPAPSNETSPLNRAIDDLRTAIGLLTRLPSGNPQTDLTGACWAFPVAGAAVGICGGGILIAAISLNVPALAAALIALAAMAMLTGALHEDGLADTADGLGGANADSSLEIMRDSRIGAYGVLALIFSVALRAVAISEISEPNTGFAAVIAAAMLSRGLLPGMMHAMPLASSSGFAAAVGHPSTRSAALALGVGAIAAIALLGAAAGFVALIVAIAGVAATALLARRMIGGYNGDTLGAAQQVAETVILIAVAAGI
jgi:adenosylcobinamide-GDP ribazoletransferase